MHFKSIFGTHANFSVTLPNNKPYPNMLPPDYYIERERFSAVPTYTVHDPLAYKYYTPSSQINDIWVKLQQHAEARNAARQAAIEERTTFVAGVQTVLDAHATLAPALKMWPALWDLLPDDARTKHKDPSKRAKPEKVELGVDVRSMTGVVVAHKLAR